MLNKVDWRDKSRFPFLISWICICAFLWQVVSNILHLLSCHLVHIFKQDKALYTCWCYCFRMGLRPTKGVLLHGPPGTGKTSLAKKCVYDTGVNLFTVNGPELVSQYYGESEKALHEVFASASQATPAVVRFLYLSLSTKRKRTL